MPAPPQPQRHTRPAMWQSLTAQWQICEGSMNYLWQALALFAGFINSSGGYISKVPTNTVEKHVLWHLSTHLIGNLGLQDCRMHLRSQVASIIHRKCKNYRTRSSSPSKMLKTGSQIHTITRPNILFYFHPKYVISTTLFLTSTIQVDEAAMLP